MNLFGAMDISASALKAERVRAEVVASNMANAETTRTSEGGPYRRHHVVFSAQGSGSFGQSLLQQMQVGDGASSAGWNSASQNSLQGGVEVSGVVEDGAPPLRRYDPQHPDAGTDGFVEYPDINPLTEMVDLMGATRSYGMNASAVQAEKSMVGTSLDLLK